MGAAPGLRESGYNNRLGTLYNVGVYGYSWASAIPAATGVGHRAYCLGYYYGGFGPNNGGNRAYGFQLRCLQE